MSLAQLRGHFGVSRDTLTEWLRGLPTPEWTRRPTAKDELRDRAVELREQGCSVPDIATKLGVAKSSAYLWTRHIPLDRTPEESAERSRRHMEHMRESRWEPHRQARDAERATTNADAAVLVRGRRHPGRIVPPADAEEAQSDHRAPECRRLVPWMPGHLRAEVEPDLLADGRDHGRHRPE